MNRHVLIKQIFVLVLLCLAGLMLGSLILAPGATRQVQAQVDREPAAPTAPESHSSYIPVQGRLTDVNGVPLQGSHTVTFRIYNQFSGGTPLCESTKTFTVEDGYFSTYIYGGDCQIDGQMLYLGIEVGDDGEMTPRSYIDNVPYAWTLRPGAIISETLGNNALLHLENWASDGRSLRAYAMSTTGQNYAIVGAARSPDGYGGYFYNNGGGVGLYGSSDTDAAIRAGGSGIIQSTAPTYVWISGNDVRPYNQGDSTTINLDSIGGAFIVRGAVAGNKNVMLPITVPGVLYGQNARVTDLDLYWMGATDFDVITAVLMRRQINVCSASTCYATLLHDTADHVCDQANNPTGCVQHYDLTTNNVLTADSGILYLTLELVFSGAASWVELGGARLTLVYDN